MDIEKIKRHLSDGIELFQEGDIENSLTHFSLANYTAQNQDSHFWIGQVRLQQNNKIGALTNYLYAIRHFKDHPELMTKGDLFRHIKEQEATLNQGELKIWSQMKQTSGL
jgi:hypothetical protein